MASNAVSATIARCKAQHTAGNNAQVTLQSVATAAGYPGNRASSVRGLARANGHGARANGQTRYTTNTHGGWYTALTGLQLGLSPQATKAQVAKAKGKGMHNALLGKAKAAGQQGARQAKRTRKATQAPAPAPQGAPQGS